MFIEFIDDHDDHEFCMQANQILLVNVRLRNHIVAIETEFLRSLSFHSALSVSIKDNSSGRSSMTWFCERRVDDAHRLEFWRTQRRIQKVWLGVRSGVYRGRGLGRG